MQRFLTSDLYPGKIRAFQMTKQLYKSCINTKLSDHTGTKALLDVPNEIGNLLLLKGAQLNDNNWNCYIFILYYRNFQTNLFYITLMLLMNWTSKQILKMQSNSN